MTALEHLTTPPEIDTPDSQPNAIKISQYCLTCPLYLDNLKLGSYSSKDRVYLCAASTAIVGTITSPNTSTASNPLHKKLAEQQIAQCAAVQTSDPSETAPKHWLPESERVVEAQDKLNRGKVAIISS